MTLVAYAIFLSVNKKLEKVFGEKMLTPGSIDYRLNEGLQLRGMPVDQFCIVAAKENIRFASKAKLYEAFRGVKALENETAKQLWKLWLEIEQMASSFEPFSLDLTEGDRVYEWLVARRKGEIFSVVVGGLPAYDGEKEYGSS